MTREEWVARFTGELIRLGSAASQERIAELSGRLWPLLRAVEPEAAARGEFDLWQSDNEIRSDVSL
jgi:hypothetical protein